MGKVLSLFSVNASPVVGAQYLRFLCLTLRLSQAFPCTGDVLLKQTYDKCVKPDGIFDGRKVADKDVIELKSGELRHSMPITSICPAIQVCMCVWQQGCGGNAHQDCC